MIFQFMDIYSPNRLARLLACSKIRISFSLLSRKKLLSLFSSENSRSRMVSNQSSQTKCSLLGGPALKGQ